MMVNLGDTKSEATDSVPGGGNANLLNKTLYDDIYIRECHLSFSFRQDIICKVLGLEIG